MVSAESFIDVKAELGNMATKAISAFHVFLMLTLIIFWGSSFVVVKLILNEGLTPVGIATFRFLIAGGFFLAVLLLRKGVNRHYRLLVEGRDALALLALALAGVTFFFTIQYTGIEMAGASIAAILVCLLSPILITVFSAKIFKEHLTKKQVLGIGIAAAGTFTVVVGGSPSFQGNTEFFLGTLLLLSTPLLWATYTLLGKKIMQRYDAFLVVAYVTMLGGLCLVPFSLAENSFCQVFSLSLYEWLAILYLAVTCSLVGYYIWFYVLKKVDAAVTSSFLFVEPLITGVFAVTFAGETLNLFILAGGLLIFAGLYLVTKR
jgi:drug/metabolite transporter (DMT)-like permease